MKRFIVLCALVIATGVSAKTIATVNGHAIDEREANAFLKVATKGKVTYKRLRKKDKVALVERLAVDKMVLTTAMKEIGKKEQESIIAGFWLRKKAAKYKISDKEVKDAYKKNKKFFKDKKGKTIPFAKVKEMIRNSIAQKKAVAKMMKNAKIVMNGKVISASKEKSTKHTGNKPQSKRVSGRYSVYTVKSGNTLSGIANKYGMNSKQLRKMNGMSATDVLKIGQKLKVPAK